MIRLLQAIDRKLAAMLSTGPPNPWHDEWFQLGPASTPEERLKVCQAIRDSASLPEDVGYFLVAWAMEYLAENEQNAQRHEPFQTLNLFESMRASERQFSALLEAHGEVQMANLFHTAPDEHDRRREAGRLYFFKASTDKQADQTDWLNILLGTIAANAVASKSVDRLAYRYRSHDFLEELDVCPPANVGPGWAVDIESLRKSFDKISSCGWYAAPTAVNCSPYFWIEGEFIAQEVCMRLLPAVEAGQEYQIWESQARGRP